MVRKESLILFFILLAGLFLRLYKINIPLADHHSWRQADTAAVARNFIKEEFNLLKPRIDNFSPTNGLGRENKERLFLTEFPIYNAVIAILYKFFRINLSLARGVTIFFSLGSVLLLYFLGKVFFNELTAIFLAFLYALLPFNIFFGRVILPEPAMVFFSLLGIYLLINSYETKSRLRFFLSSICLSLSILIKIYALFLILPLLYLIFKKEGLRCVKKAKYYLWWLIVLVPIFAWRVYIRNFPEGIPGSDWLLNQGGIRFTGAFFRWIIFERMDKLILSGPGIFLFFLGVILKPKKREGWFFHLWLLSIFVYFIIFARGNVTHDYYQIIFVPIALIFVAKGANYLIFAPKRAFSKTLSLLILISSFLIMEAFGWYNVRDFYNLKGGTDTGGAAVDRLTPKDTLVITGGTADVTLLYNTNRYGWVTGFGAYYPETAETIEVLRKKGAQVFVTTKVGEVEDKTKTFGKYLLDNYKVLERTNDYIIFDLQNKQ